MSRLPTSQRFRWLVGWVARFPHGTPEKVELYDANTPNKIPKLLDEQEIKKIREKSLASQQKLADKLKKMEIKDKVVKEEDKENLINVNDKVKSNEEKLDEGEQDMEKFESKRESSENKKAD